jgi:hypothetical protein
MAEFFAVVNAGIYFGETNVHISVPVGHTLVIDQNADEHGSCGKSGYSQRFHQLI